MTRRSDQRAAITETLAAYVLENGLGETSLRQLAKAANVSDRMLLYYFEDKFEVLSLVMQSIAGTFTLFLDDALPHKAPRSMSEIFQDVVALTGSPGVQPFMSLWLETIAAATRGTEPYKSAAVQIGAGFLNWIERRLPPSPDARGDAALVLTLIEGLAVMNACTDEDTRKSAEASIQQILPN